MAMNLTKGKTMNLRKDAHDLDELNVGLGWKVWGKLSGLFGKRDDAEFDLDAIAFPPDEHDKVRNRGNCKRVGGDVVFFNCSQHSSGTVTYSGDTYGDGTGAADDERIVVRLNSVPTQVHQIFCSSASTRAQNSDSTSIWSSPPTSALWMARATKWSAIRSSTQLPTTGIHRGLRRFLSLQWRPEVPCPRRRPSLRQLCPFVEGISRNLVMNNDQKLRDRSGKLLGKIKLLGISKREGRDASSRLNGTYDLRLNETRDSSGRLVGKGNLLSNLVTAP